MRANLVARISPLAVHLSEGERLGTGDSLLEIRVIIIINKIFQQGAHVTKCGFQ